MGAPGSLLHRRHLPRARLRRAAAGRGVCAAGGGGGADEGGAAAPALRRAGARGAPAQRRDSGGERGDGDAHPLAGGGHPPPRCRQRALPAGGVRRRPVAGASRRGDGRVPRSGGVLPAHLPHREPEGDAGGGRAAPHRSRAATRWCSCRPTSGAGRRTPCWPSTTSSPASTPPGWPGSTPCCRRRRRGRCPARGGWCWWAPSSRPATRTPSRTGRWCAPCGGSWPGSSGGRRPSPASPRTTSGRPARGTPYGSCSRSTAPAWS